MAYKRWIIENEGVPIGFFSNKKDATEALTMYVQKGTVSERTFDSYTCWNNRGEYETVGE